MRPGERELTPELARIRQLAREVAAADSGPAGELACALADAVLVVADRVDNLWQLIAAVVAAAEPPPGRAAGREVGAGPPPAEFLQALAAGRGARPGAGHRGIRLNIGGRDFVAAISPQHRPADAASAWSALERLATAQEPGWPDPPD